MADKLDELIDRMHKEKVKIEVEENTDWLRKFGDPSDVVNINPYTEDFIKAIQDYIDAGPWNLEEMLPIIQALSEQMTNPLANLIREDAQGKIPILERTLSDQYAKQGAFRSGAYQKAFGMGVGEALRGAETDIAKLQLGTTQNLLGISAQTNPFLAALQSYGQMAQPEYWQPGWIADPQRGIPEPPFDIFNPSTW